VNLRNLVPALALAVVAAAPAMAADAAPAVSFAGWSDNILTFHDDDTKDDPATDKKESAGSLRFTSVASLKAMWKVTDKLTAKVNLWFNPDNAVVDMREGYFAWSINDSVTWSMGKYIDHIGWISAEPTGLYTINNSLIGYLQTYGNDVLGTSIAVAPKDSPLSGSFHVTNGYYTASDALNGPTSAGRENTALGFGLDLIYELPDKKGNVNLEFAYDMGSAGNAGTTTAGVPPVTTITGIGGDVFLVGLNATITPVKPLLIGAEIQYMTVGEGKTATGAKIVNSDSTRTQGLLLVNYALEGASIPMSISGEVQYVTIDTNTADNETRLGLQAALLTNPLGSTNFGLNFEVGYFDETHINGAATNADLKGLNLAVEGLVTF